MQNFIFFNFGKKSYIKKSEAEIQSFCSGVYRGCYAD